MLFARTALAIAVGTTLFAGQASAATTVTYDVSFSASTFVDFFGNDPAPVDPVTGSFRISFDPTQAYDDATDGISLLSLNIALDSTLAFDYSPTGYPFLAPGVLSVGGINGGATGVLNFPPNNDFNLQIADFATDPTFAGLGYRQASTDEPSFLFTTEVSSISLSVTPGGVPEPSTWTMMLVGFALVGAAIRKQRHATRVTYA